MEVTTATRQDLRALYARFEREGTDLVAAVGDKSWQLSLNADADLSALRRRKDDVARALRDLESGGITNFLVCRDNHTHQEVGNFADRFPQVRDAWAFAPSARGPMVVLVGPGHTTFIGPDLVTRMIEQFASHPEREGDRYKLRKAGTSETHLFVWIEQHEFGAYESLCGEDLPESVPRLPREITSVGVAATCRKGGIRVWFVRPPAPWQEIRGPWKGGSSG